MYWLKELGEGQQIKLPANEEISEWDDTLDPRLEEVGVRHVEAQ